MRIECIFDDSFHYRLLQSNAFSRGESWRRQKIHDARSIFIHRQLQSYNAIMQTCVTVRRRMIKVCYI